MHTFLTRANALAAYTMSVLAALTFMCFLSTFLFETYSAPAKMNTVKVVVKHVPDYSASREKNDLGMVFFIPGRQKILKRSWNKELAEQKYLLSWTFYGRIWMILLEPLMFFLNVHKILDIYRIVFISFGTLHKNKEILYYERSI